MKKDKAFTLISFVSVNTGMSWHHEGKKYRITKIQSVEIIEYENKVGAIKVKGLWKEIGIGKQYGGFAELRYENEGEILS